VGRLLPFPWIDKSHDQPGLGLEHVFPVAVPQTTEHLNNPKEFLGIGDLQDAPPEYVGLLSGKLQCNVTHVDAFVQ